MGQARGAVKSAINDVEPDQLTALLNKINPAIPATTFGGKRTSKNADIVDAVAAANVLRTVEGNRRQSSVLAGTAKVRQDQSRRIDVSPGRWAGEILPEQVNCTT
jgi:hypothetical protein